MGVQLLTPQQLADRWQTSVATIYRLIRQDGLPIVRLHDKAAPGSSRCRVHGRRAWATRPPANCYAYGGDWPERRVRVLKRDGYACQLCYADICLGRASQVDHIVQPEAGGTNALENLRAVCVRCHARRTGRQGALAKQRAAQRRNPR